MKKLRARRKWISDAFADRPLPPWSEDDAAIDRQIPGMIIGPAPVLDIDRSDPQSVRTALDRQPFGHLIPYATIEDLCPEGMSSELFPEQYPIWRYGIDDVTYPCLLVAPTIEELEALEDKEWLAHIILKLDIRGTTSRIQRLIKSTVEPEWCWLGEIAQENLKVCSEGEPVKELSRSPPVPSRPSTAKGVIGNKMKVHLISTTDFGPIEVVFTGPSRLLKKGARRELLTVIH